MTLLLTCWPIATVSVAAAEVLDVGTGRLVELDHDSENLKLLVGDLFFDLGSDVAGDGLLDY